MYLKFFLTFFFLFSYSTLYGIESNTELFEETEVKIILGKKDERVLDIGLDFSIPKGWKIYWIYPGDTGLPPELTLLNYKNYSFLTPSWPFPDEEFDESIKLTSRIYKNKIIIPYKFTLKDNIAKEKKLEFNLDYQVCKDICIPVSTKLLLEIPEKNYFNKENMDKLNISLNKVPSASTSINNQIEAIKIEKKKIILKVNNINFPKVKDNDISAILHNKYFPTLRTTKVKAIGNKIEVTLEGEEEIILNEEISRVFLKLDNNYFFSKVIVKNIKNNNHLNNKKIYIILITAFFAGFVLNFMPCVLPILGIKINNLLKQSETRNRRIVKLSSFYVSLGIISMFLVFCLTAILLRVIGINLGWGMQFQSPIFLLFLIILLLLFSIIAFDLIKINFLQKYIKISLLEKQVLKNNIFISNFFTGILSTLLATPCTAPLVGTAISLALSQSYGLSVIIFLLMGLGKSAPYIIFIFRPSILWYLPKSGVWTKYFKAFTGILLIISLVWLISLLIKHYPGYKLSDNDAYNSKGNWQEFNKDKLNYYLNNNEKVFIDITADWCLNCKVNKKLVLDNKEVLEFFKKNNINLMRADWTFPDNNILDFLQTYNRYGIPFNIFFSEKYKEGFIFNEILNKTQLIKILSD